MNNGVHSKGLEIQDTSVQATIAIGVINFRRVHYLYRIKFKRNLRNNKHDRIILQPSDRILICCYYIRLNYENKSCNFISTC
jgi:hypothetical protein